MEWTRATPPTRLPATLSTGPARPADQNAWTLAELFVHATLAAGQGSSLVRAGESIAATVARLRELAGAELDTLAAGLAGPPGTTTPGLPGTATPEPPPGVDPATTARLRALQAAFTGVAVPLRVQLIRQESDGTYSAGPVPDGTAPVHHLLRLADGTLRMLWRSPTRRALTTLTLLAAGVPRDDPGVRRALQDAPQAARDEFLRRWDDVSARIAAVAHAAEAQHHLIAEPVWEQQFTRTVDALRDEVDTLVGGLSETIEAAQLHAVFGIPTDQVSPRHRQALRQLRQFAGDPPRLADAIRTMVDQVGILRRTTVSGSVARRMMIRAGLGEPGAAGVPPWARRRLLDLIATEQELFDVAPATPTTAGAAPSTVDESRPARDESSASTVDEPRSAGDERAASTVDPRPAVDERAERIGRLIRLRRLADAIDATRNANPAAWRDNAPTISGRTFGPVVFGSHLLASLITRWRPVNRRTIDQGVAAVGLADVVALVDLVGEAKTPGRPVTLDRLRHLWRQRGTPLRAFRSTATGQPAHARLALPAGTDPAMRLPDHLVENQLLGQGRGSLRPGHQHAILDAARATASNAPHNDPGWDQLADALVNRFRDTLVDGATVVVDRDGVPTEVTVRGVLVNELTEVPQLPGSRRIDTGSQSVRSRTYGKDIARPREYGAGMSALLNAIPFGARLAAALRLTRDQPTRSMRYGVTLLGQKITRSGKGARLYHADVQWQITTRVGGAGVRTLRQDWLATPGSALLELPEYLLRADTQHRPAPPDGTPATTDPTPRAAVLSEAPESLDLAGEIPRVFTIEDLDSTAALRSSLLDAVRYPDVIGGHPRTVVTDLAQRRTVANYIDQMLDTYRVSPVLRDAEQRPVGAVRTRVWFGQAQLLSVTEPGEVTMRFTGAMAPRTTIGTSRDDGWGVAFGVGVGFHEEFATLTASAALAPAGHASYDVATSQELSSVAVERQMVDAGGVTALYRVAVEFEVQPLGGAPLERGEFHVLLRMQAEEARRLHERDAFVYTAPSNAPSRPDRTPTNNDAVQPPQYLARTNPTTIGPSFVADITEKPPTPTESAAGAPATGSVAGAPVAGSAAEAPVAGSAAATTTSGGAGSRPRSGAGRRLYEQLLAALRAASDDLVPDWETADVAVLAADPAQLVAVVSNHRALAEGVGRSTLRAGLTTVIDHGLVFVFRRLTRGTSHHYVLTVKGTLSNRQHRGTVARVLPADITISSGSSLASQGRSGRVSGSVDFSGWLKAVAKPVSAHFGVGASIGAGRADHPSYGHGATSYRLSYSLTGVEVFDYDLTVVADLTGYSRPRQWRRSVVLSPFVGGWRFTPWTPRRLIGPAEPGIDGVAGRPAGSAEPFVVQATLWTPSDRSWLPAPGSTPRARDAATSDVLPITPEQAETVIWEPRQDALLGAFHPEAVDHPAGELIRLARELMRVLGVDLSMLANTDTAVDLILINELGGTKVKGRFPTFAAPGGLAIGGLFGDGVYTDRNTGLRVRLTLDNLRVSHDIDNLVSEEYYNGGVGVSNQNRRSRWRNLSVGVGVGGTPLTHHDPPDVSSPRRMAGRLTVTYTWHDRLRRFIAYEHIAGQHERNRSHVGRYQVLVADLIYTLAGSARTTNAAIELLPLVQGTMRQAALQRRIRDGVHLDVADADIRDLGLLAHERPLPQPLGPMWLPPEPLRLGLGLAMHLVDRHVDLTGLLTLIQQALPARLRAILPAEVADDAFGALQEIIAALSSDGINAFIDNLLDGGVALPLRRRGWGDHTPVRIVLRLRLVGTPVFETLRPDIDVENYHIGIEDTGTGQDERYHRGVRLNTFAGEGQSHGQSDTLVPGMELRGQAVFAHDSRFTARQKLIDMTTDTGPTARFQVTFEPVVEVTFSDGRRQEVEGAENLRVDVPVVVPEVASLPGPIADLATVPPPPPRIRLLRDHEAADDRIAGWKNDPDAYRLPNRRTVIHTWGAGALRLAAERLLHLLATGGIAAPGDDLAELDLAAGALGLFQSLATDYRAPTGMQNATLWAALNNILITGLFHRINDADDRDNGVLPPLDGADAGLEIPLAAPVSDMLRGRPVRLRLLANVRRPRLQNVTGSSRENIRLEQRRITETDDDDLYRSVDVMNGGLAFQTALSFLGTGNSQAGDNTAGQGDTAADHGRTQQEDDFGAVGVETTPMAGEEGESVGAAGKSDVYLNYRDITGTFEFVADIEYRLIATVGGHTAAIEVLVSDGIRFKLRTQEARDTGLVSEELLAALTVPLANVDTALNDLKPHLRTTMKSQGLMATAMRAVDEAATVEADAWDLLTALAPDAAVELAGLRAEYADLLAPAPAAPAATAPATAGAGGGGTAGRPDRSLAAALATHERLRREAVQAIEDLRVAQAQASDSTETVPDRAPATTPDATAPTPPATAPTAPATAPTAPPATARTRAEQARTRALARAATGAQRRYRAWEDAWAQLSDRYQRLADALPAADAFDAAPLAPPPALDQEPGTGRSTPGAEPRPGTDSPVDEAPAGEHGAGSATVDPETVAQIRADWVAALRTLAERVRATLADRAALTDNYARYTVLLERLHAERRALLRIIAELTGERPGGLRSFAVPTWTAADAAPSPTPTTTTTGDANLDVTAVPTGQTIPLAPPRDDDATTAAAATPSDVTIPAGATFPGGSTFLGGTSFLGGATFAGGDSFPAGSWLPGPVGQPLVEEGEDAESVLELAPGAGYPPLNLD